jgi:seryl-tRNA synthetase
MASAGEDAVEDALNVLVSVTEKSGKLRNDLRKDILKAVSNLRKEFAKLKSEVEDKNKLIVDLQMKATETNSALKELQFGVGNSCRGVKETTSLGLNSKDSDCNVVLSAGILS